jgi:hypothetical protein
MYSPFFLSISAGKLSPRLKKMVHYFVQRFELTNDGLSKTIVGFCVLFVYFINLNVLRHRTAVCFKFSLVERKHYFVPCKLQDRERLSLAYSIIFIFHLLHESYYHL